MIAQKFCYKRLESEVVSDATNRRALQISRLIFSPGVVKLWDVSNLAQIVGCWNQPYKLILLLLLCSSFAAAGETEGSGHLPD